MSEWIDGIEYEGDVVVDSDKHIREAVIRPGTVSIGDDAFYECGELASVIFPDSLEIIGDFAFRRCRSLKSVRLPDSLVTLGQSAFRECSSLASVNLPKNITQIECSTFDGCGQLTSIALPEGLRDIADCAFAGCRNLAGLQFPGRLVCIGEAAFACCEKLTEIVLPDSLRYLCDGAFARCTALTTVALPPKLFRMGSNVFLFCPLRDTALKEDGLTYWRDRLTGADDDIVTAKIREGVKIIADNAFYGCKKLESVVFPSTLKRLCWCAFENCISLTSVTLPDSLACIDYCAFRGCESLVSVVLPAGLKVIGSGAFQDCKKIASINLPDGLVEIGDRAFAGCSELTPLALPRTRNECRRIKKSENKRLRLTAPCHRECDYNNINFDDPPVIIEIGQPWIVRKVTPQDDYTLLLQFDDGKQGVFDMWPIIKQEDGGRDDFAHLINLDEFMKAYVYLHAVFWPGDISIAPETLYNECMTLQEYEDWCAEDEE